MVKELKAWSRESEQTGEPNLDQGEARQSQSRQEKVQELKAWSRESEQTGEPNLDQGEARQSQSMQDTVLAEAGAPTAPPGL
jgi:hypothetical protein